MPPLLCTTAFPQCIWPIGKLASLLAVTVAPQNDINIRLSRTRLSSVGSLRLDSSVAMSADHASDAFLDTACASLHVPRPLHARALIASSVKTNPATSRRSETQTLSRWGEAAGRSWAEKCCDKPRKRPAGW